MPPSPSTLGAYLNLGYILGMPPDGIVIWRRRKTALFLQGALQHRSLLYASSSSSMLRRLSRNSTFLAKRHDYSGLRGTPWNDPCVIWMCCGVVLRITLGGVMIKCQVLLVLGVFRWSNMDITLGGKPRAEAETSMLRPFMGVVLSWKLEIYIDVLRRVLHELVAVSGEPSFGI